MKETLKTGAFFFNTVLAKVYTFNRLLIIVCEKTTPFIGNYSIYK
jgi:hypothetical protein